MANQLEIDFEKEVSSSPQNLKKKSLPIPITTVPTPLVLTLTGNPWADLGIVSFCKDLSSAPFPATLKLTEYEANITIDGADLETIKEWLNQRFRTKWNELYWLSRGAKILGRTSLRYDNNGFIDRDKSHIQTTEDERAQIKEQWKGSTVKDVMPLTQLRSNFIGIRGNADTFRIGQQTNIQDFIQDWGGGRGKKICEMSGKSCVKTKKLLQVVNPFATKHHNTKVRGAHGSSTNPTLGSLYYLINVWATLDENIPFHVDTAKRTTHLILPEIPDLELLAKVYDRLKENLKDLNQRKELWTFTNIRTITGSSNRYALTLSLFHNIFYEFTESETDEDGTLDGEWDFSPIAGGKTEETVRQLTRWVIIPFSKGQNVIFQNFHTIVVNDRLYDFIKPIPFNRGEIKLIPDILTRMQPKMKSPDGENALGQLSQAIAISDIRLMKVALFNLWKHTDGVNFQLKGGQPHPARLLVPFINYFLEVNQVLNDKLREDLRVLGTTIGSTFNKDVTLMSKLFNISSISAFQETLNVVMFRLYKFSTGDEAKNAIPIKQERIDSILAQLTEANCRKIAETLSIYASLSAYNANVFESKSKNEGGQND